MHLEFAEIVSGDSVQSVHISELRTLGTAQFLCPYCHATLQPHFSARLPHFTHQQEPCRYIRHYESESHTSLPLYRDFRPPDVPDLSWTQREQLERISAGELSLVEFYDLQQPIVNQVFHRFQQQLDAPKSERERRYFLTDLKLFEWTRRKCESFALYLVKVPGSSACYHLSSSGRPQYTVPKILQAELSLPQPPKLLKRVPRQGWVEFYASRRFRLNLDDSGVFRLDDDSLKALLGEMHDLRYNNAERRRRIREGMQRANAQGVELGPPRESREEFLQKPSSQKIIRLLQQGLKLREISRRSGHAPNTVRKVRAALSELKLKVKSD